MCRAITGSVSVENVHPLQGGFFRPKDRRGRRPGMPIEPIWVFYLKYLWETVSKSVRHATHWLWLDMHRRRIAREQRLAPYINQAIGPRCLRREARARERHRPVAVDSLKVLDPKRPIREADAAKLFDGPPENLKLSHYRSITVFAGISTGNPSVLPKVRRRCSHVSSCSGVFGMVT